MDENTNDNGAQNSTLKNRLKIIRDLEHELKVLKESLTDAVENDAEYQQASEKIQKIKEDVKEQKQVIDQKVYEKSAIRALKEEIAEKVQDIKLEKEVLSQELVDYYRRTGKMEIEDENGDLKRLKFNAKLVS